MTMPTTTSTDPKKPIPTTPPLNWRKEMPVYRVRVETRPSPKARFRFEQPFSQIMDQSEWQYSERVWPAGSVIASDQWPCAGTMTPLNYSAREVLSFFNSRQKSRLPRTPWADGQVRLDDGLTGTLPKILGPQVQPVGVQPAGGWPGR
jgi:hypothetical protein